MWKGTLASLQQWISKHLLCLKSWKLRMGVESGLWLWKDLLSSQTTSLLCITESMSLEHLWLWGLFPCLLPLTISCFFSLFAAYRFRYTQHPICREIGPITQRDDSESCSQSEVLWDWSGRLNQMSVFFYERLWTGWVKPVPVTAKHGGEGVGVHCRGDKHWGSFLEAWQYC